MSSIEPNLICGACGARWYSAAREFWIGRRCSRAGCDGTLEAAEAVRLVDVSRPPRIDEADDADAG